MKGFASDFSNIFGFKNFFYLMKRFHSLRTVIRFLAKSCRRRTMLIKQHVILFVFRNDNVVAILFPDVL